MKNESLFILASGAGAGKSVVALGLLDLLLRDGRRVAVFRPIVDDGPQKDAELDLLLTHFKLDMAYDDAFAMTASKAREILRNGSRGMLIEEIIGKYSKLAAAFDFTLCMGSCLEGCDPVFGYELELQTAASLGCPILLSISGQGATAADLADSLRLARESLKPYALAPVATVVSRANLTRAELDALRKSPGSGEELVFAIPEDELLGRPSLNDVKKRLDAETVFGADKLERQVGGFLAAAMHLDNFLNHLQADQLVLTPGDRSDILLAAAAASLSSAWPQLAGVVLTGGLRLPESARKLVDGLNSPLPVLFTRMNTYEAVSAMRDLRGVIEPGDKAKIDAALALFAQCVNGGEIIERLLEERKEKRMPPLMFEYELIGRAKREPQRIVLAEGEDERILRAADILLRREVARIILLGDVDAIREKARALNADITGARLIDPLKSPDFERYAEAYYEFRKAKGVTLEDARKTMRDATYFGTMMVKLDDADGMVSGAVNTTAHTIRPAFEFIKTRPGFSVVSSIFLMCLKDRVLAFGDCAVNPEPTSQQLAEIAIASAHTAEIFGITPRVAMLSYSTGKSGKGPAVDKVVEAVKIAKEMRPDLMLEGPLQYDAAIDPVVAQTKLPGSQVAGRATVFIFPDLNTGNNTYKAVQRAADAIAIGPVLQGLNKPVNDLSRGCMVPDIVNTVAITAVQAAADRKSRQCGCK